MAVKLTVGEPGGRYYLSPDLIRELVQSVNGTLVDGNTAYKGQRSSTDNHLKAAQEHGFLTVAPMDILDAEGEIILPIKGGAQLAEVRVGSHFANYDFLLTLTHFKGHAMAGFGGSIKNLSIGLASPAGKCLIHTAGQSDTNMMDGPEKQEDFQEAMAEATLGMIESIGRDRAVYINVMNNLSIDCDCDSNPAKPEIHDIGILASLDPVALDKACLDLIFQADDQDSAALRKRVEDKKGIQQRIHAEKIGLGRQNYKLVSLD